jgi:hypothetical protein
MRARVPSASSCKEETVPRQRPRPARARARRRVARRRRRSTQPTSQRADHVKPISRWSASASARCAISCVRLAEPPQQAAQDAENALEDASPSRGHRQRRVVVRPPVRAVLLAAPPRLPSPMASKRRFLTPRERHRRLKQAQPVDLSTRVVGGSPGC